jgi:hypothetical protein
MQMISTQICPSVENRFSLAYLLETTGRIRSAIIISAYTDVEMLNSAIKKITKIMDRRSGVIIQIYLDYFASGYSMEPGRKKDLDKIAKKLKRQSDKGGVWLVRNGRLFHSKLVMIKSNRDIKVAVGSLNMTNRAFSYNEELVVFGSGSLDTKATAFQMGKWVKDTYCPRLQKTSEALPQMGRFRILRDTIREILLDGRIFHEIKENDPFRFQIGLPEKVLAIPADVHPLLEAKMVDSISLLTLLTGSRKKGGLGVTLPEIQAAKKSRKKYCIDTCYGQWCPHFLLDEAREALEQRTANRKPYFEKVFDAIREKKNDLTYRFFQVAEALNKHKDIINDPLWSLETVKEHWRNWYERLLKKLDLAEFQERVIKGIDDAPVPNVWSDPLSAKEFETSFAESFMYGCLKGVASQFRKVVKKLIEVYELDEEIIRNASSPEQVIGYIEHQAHK